MQYGTLNRRYAVSMRMIILVFLSSLGVFVASAACSDDDDVRITLL